MYIEFNSNLALLTSVQTVAIYIYGSNVRIYLHNNNQDVSIFQSCDFKGSVERAFG